MKVTSFFSGTDNGFDAVLAAIATQPESVLSICLFSQTPSKDSGLSDCVFDTFTELVEEMGMELSKHQLVVLITRNLNNALDLTATVFAIRGLNYLYDLAAFIPDVPASWDGEGFPDCKQVTDYHELILADYERWVLGNYNDQSASDCWHQRSASLTIQEQIKRGYNALTKRNREFAEKREAANAKTIARVESARSSESSS